MTAHGEHPADSAAAPALRVRDLGKSYGELLAVDGVSFEVAAGEILGLLGPNGAGKTTIINTILAVLTPSAGSRSCSRNSSSKRCATPSAACCPRGS